MAQKPRRPAGQLSIQYHNGHCLASRWTQCKGTAYKSLSLPWKQEATIFCLLFELKGLTVTDMLVQNNCFTAQQNKFVCHRAIQDSNTPPWESANGILYHLSKLLAPEVGLPNSNRGANGIWGSLSRRSEQSIGQKALKCVWSFGWTIVRMFRIT